MTFRPRLLKVLLAPLLATLVPAAAQAQCEGPVLLAPAGLEGDHLGGAVALDGDRALVSAPGEAAGAPGSGAVHVFRRQGFTWTQEQLLVRPVPGPNYEFGSAVALNGDLAVCGVPFDGDQAFWTGSVEVFRFDGTTWQHEQRLTASDASSGARFGSSVDCDGERILVGARSEGGQFVQTGAAYVFRHDGVQWVEERKLVAPDPGVMSQFGYAVGLDGESAVIGAWRDDDGGLFSGSAYVFRDGATGWALEQKLLASDLFEFYRFGGDVTIQGDRLAVSAYEADVMGFRAGAVYVFERAGTTWTETARLTASDTDAPENFGWAIDLDDDLIAISNRRDATPVVESGSIYLFQESGGSWTEISKQTASTSPGGLLGQSLALSGDLVLAGAWQSSLLSLEAGAAHLFSAGADCGPGQNLCACPSSVAPCGNGSDASTGCTNSLGQGAALRSEGSASVAAADLVLVAGGLPNRPGLFFQGDLSLGTGALFGDGLRCAGGAVVRLGVALPTAGAASFPSSGAQPSIPAIGGALPGQTRIYQLWYRDLSGPCSTGFNTTNAVAVEWRS